MDKATILIADDHPLFRDALKQAIEGLEFPCVIYMAGALGEAQDILSESRDIDLVLLDLAMPGASGFSGLAQLRSEYPAIPAVVISATEDPTTIRRCLDLGASGFIPKSSSGEAIRTGVKEVLGGNIWVPDGIDLDVEDDPETAEMFQRIKSLTPQQARVLGMLGEGLLNKQIAYELNVSEATVKAHVSAVLLKLGVDSRTQAVIIMNKIGAGLGIQPKEG
ncbi:MAG: response regulator transcription factor [Rhizobiaceae bacterium]|nr:response regulator transcription factor [Rhizobiaceae bacterium]MBL4697073.1 response regulator transcription factor [Rhizobiaceae bacterium]